MTISTAAVMPAYAANLHEQRPSADTSPAPPERETVANMNARYQDAAREVSNFLASDRGKALGDFTRLQAHLGSRLDVTA